MMRKAYVLFLTCGVILGILLPIHENFRGVVGDSFPFSWYPMFSRPRPDPDSANYVVGLTQEGERVYIHSNYYVRGGMNQARRQLDYIVHHDKTQDTCERAARNVARSNNEKYAKVTRLRVARGWFHMKEFFSAGNKLPVKERVYARCKVDRSASKEEPER